MKLSDKIFLTEKWIQRHSVFITAIIACALTLGNQCKHLLSQLTLGKVEALRYPWIPRLISIWKGVLTLQICDWEEMHGNNEGIYELICIK